MAELIVDTHTHVVSSDLDRYPINPGVADEQGWHRDHPIDTEGLLELGAAHGVSSIALVQAISCHGFDNRYVLDSARANPGRTIAVVAADPTKSAMADALRNDVAAGAQGVRVFSVGGTTASLDDPGVRAVAAAAGDLGIPVVLLAIANQLPSVGPLVSAFPSVRFVLDHCGFVDLSQAFAQAEPLFALADVANLALKVSSITLQSTDQPAQLWTQLVARFGAERLMWGSDFPHTHEPGYGGLVELARSSTAHLSPADRTAILAATAKGLWPQRV